MACLLPLWQNGWAAQRHEAHTSGCQKRDWPLTQVRIGFGGGCHWCTEAVFQSLRGVQQVDQGFIRSSPPNDSFSEAVIVTYDPALIPLDVLVSVHLRTHASTSRHSMRGKYRSAVYTFDGTQAEAVRRIIAQQQAEFDKPVITATVPYVGFKASPEQFQDYYLTNTGRPFCATYIDPKLAKIRQLYSQYCDQLEQP